VVEVSEGGIINYSVGIPFPGVDVRAHVCRSLSAAVAWQQGTQPWVFLALHAPKGFACTHTHTHKHTHTHTHTHTHSPLTKKTRINCVFVHGHKLISNG